MREARDTTAIWEMDLVPALTPTLAALAWARISIGNWWVTIDYEVSSWFDAHAGFRSLNFSYGAPRANFTFNLTGPIISATLRF